MRNTGGPNSTQVPHELRYWETHGGKTDPAEIVRTGYFKDIETEALKNLSQKALIPVATLRGAGSFYEDLSSENTGTNVKVCIGTSCHLSGGAKQEQNICRSGHHCEHVSCLGHCDRSPVSLDENTLEFADIPTTIRCHAPHPIVTKNILEGNAAGIKQAIQSGIYSGLPAALDDSPETLIETIEKSGERGRGGAGYSTGQKWRVASEAVGDRKYVIANGDEGDPGSFIDRVLMEEDPHSIIEGMILCGYAIGAGEGIVYIRSEYPHSTMIMDKAIADARTAGFLGENICQSGFDFDIRIFVGMGSYVCGEETALIQSIEGFRGEVQIRPPFPTAIGLYGKPTVVNNVETLVNIPYIVRHGADNYRKMGTDKSCGTKAICLNAGFARPGIVEIEFGVSLRQIIEDIGGGGANDQELAAVLIGGPMGSIVVPNDWDLPVCYDVLEQHDIQLGHGGIIAIPENTDFRSLLEHLIDFSIRESCGKCVPCRLGTQRLRDALSEGQTADQLLEITETIELGSLCAFGRYIPGPINTLLRDFGHRIFES